jgi:hypothetical protein
VTTERVGAEPEEALVATAPGPAAPAPATSPARVLDLQRRAGNRAVVRMVAGGSAPTRTQPRLQRREVLAPDDGQTLSPQDWRFSDRRDNTDAWKQACQFNLIHVRNGEYRHIAERRDFYKWFYDATADRGYWTRWALAAYIVAGGMEEMASVDYSEGLSPITNELQGLTRIGNQVIFDDVLPKLKKLWDGPPLKGDDAKKWDEQTLAEEQNLIQNLYKGLSADTMERFASMADLKYYRAKFGKLIRLGGRVDAGDHNTGGSVPTFHELVPDGDIRNVKDRWLYGMRLAGRFSTLPSYGDLDPMPAVTSDYSTSAQFDRLNVRPHLHRVDAMMNDTVSPSADIVKELKALNKLEQTELQSDAYRMLRLPVQLGYADMLKALKDLPYVRLWVKLSLLHSTLSLGWTTVGYDEIQPLVLLAAKTDKAFLTDLWTDYWRDQFVAICNKKTIQTAVVDLQLPPDKAADWIKHE